MKKVKGYVIIVENKSKSFMILSSHSIKAYSPLIDMLNVPRQVLRPNDFNN